MAFQLSSRSLNNLKGVNPVLVRIVKRAIELTSIDFAVIEGMRTIETQMELVKKGASQTLQSKHLTGDAVDLMAYIHGRGSWELNVYDDIADAMKQAAIENNQSIRWGGAWNVNDIRDWNDTMQTAMNHYIDTQRAQGRRPFIDAPHWEIS